MPNWMYFVIACWLVIVACFFRAAYVNWKINTRRDRENTKLRHLLPVLLILMLFFIPDDAFAQFKDKGPKGDALRYNSWIQKQHSFNGFKLNRGQRNALGLSNGLFGTGLFANRTKSRNKSNKSTTSKK